MGKRHPISTQYGTATARAQARDALITRRTAHDEKTAPRNTRAVRDVLIRHQGISILTQLSGPQYVTARATNTGQVGAFLTVVIGTVVITISDPAAARRYAGAWLDHRTFALGLPTWSATETRSNRYAEPGVVICATATDHIAVHPTDTTVQLIIGRVSWEVLDRTAFTTVAAMWQEVAAKANAIWPA